MVLYTEQHTHTSTNDLEYVLLHNSILTGEKLGGTEDGGVVAPELSANHEWQRKREGIGPHKWSRMMKAWRWWRGEMGKSKEEKDIW